MRRPRAMIPEIKCISNIIGRYMAYESYKYGLENITGQQMHILGFLNKAQECSRDVFQRDIETELNVRPPTATAMLKTLEKNGLIKRESMKNDARLKKIVLTQRAEMLSESALTMMNEAEQCISKGLTQEEKDTFYRIMAKMRENLCSVCDTNKTSKEAKQWE